MRSHRSYRVPALLLVALVLSACASYQPGALRSELPADTVPAQLQGSSKGDLPALAWRGIVTDPRLVQLVERALVNNLDLRLAALNIDAARAAYRITDAALLPTVTTSGTVTRARSSAALGTGVATTQYGVSLGVAAWEIDLWGRLGDLKSAALASYLSKEETRASVQATLISETLQAWLTLSADRQLARLAQETLDDWKETLSLTERRQALGAASTLDVAAAQASVQTARADLASVRTQVDQDRNALRVLLGGELDEALLPGEQEADDLARLPAVPGDLSSAVLLRRPDVRAAERSLQAQEANVAAARAALFPSISLTTSAGQASTSLETLSQSGQRTWSIAPSISLPIFDGGAAKAQLQSARVDQQIALTNYQKTLQTAFEEAANALAIRQRIDERLAAQGAQVLAYETVLRLTETQRKLGAASAQTVLTAQLNLYAAQKTLISLRLTEQANRLTLYKVLGGA
ncbi:efflux transporter outer membrane subunit [Hylemonella gracilis]|uniref:Outer membrane drug efflux lipoprotein n=1 Tax=Hylemonella gracilis ATCC 19624 TaxID=887062 RepID=F3KV59_9BURK|nr:efflux transporter outer membrane subunit [Hylemonella gracilis]EGI76334.1 outer membrane drug efflux lipoprotein [Hylemonella gracilis ATCC 19624]